MAHALFLTKLAVQWKALLLCTGESPETGYYNFVIFRDFPVSASFHILSISLIISNSGIRHYTVYATDSAVK
jgi:hypothetical protein